MLLRSSFTRRSLMMNATAAVTVLDTARLEDSIRILTPFMKQLNLKFTFFPVDWPLRVLMGECEAVELFMKRFHLSGSGEFISKEIVLKFMRGAAEINDEAFDNLCQLNRKLEKRLKLSGSLVECLLDARSQNSPAVRNLETLADALELVNVQKYVTSEFLNEYLQFHEFVNMKVFLLVVKIAEKKRVVRELFKRFGALQRILFANELNVEANRATVECLLAEISASNRFKINTDDDPFYDLNLSRSDYLVLFALIYNKELIKGRFKLVSSELRLAQVYTSGLHERTFAYLLQQPDLKIRQGNLRRLKWLVSADQLSTIKPELFALFLKLDETKLNAKNLKRILNCENNTHVNKSVDFDAASVASPNTKDL